jgi:hypothetical protein
MITQQFLRATIAAMLVWIMGVTAFVLSYLVPLMENPDTQANWVLGLTLIPATALGAAFYYREGFRTNGLVLGNYMFAVTILLDALITVPVFIFPIGGDHFTFFGDPVFWLIGLEYISLIVFYAKVHVKLEHSPV